MQLAAAIAHDPALLLLDEPFSGLDPVASDVMATLLTEQAERGVPVLFSSHQLELVERLCDRVTIIAEGRIVTSGGIEQLRRERSGRRVAVAFADAPPDPPAWETLDGVLEAATDGATTTLRLRDDADEQAVLDLARTSGRVVRFAPVEPTLAELYREVTA